VVTIPVPGELPPTPFARTGLFLPFMLALVAVMATFPWKNAFFKTKNHTMI
jgi:hypothetical protein